MEKDGLSLRPATMQDADLLLEWRNDLETRKASHNAAEVRREDHIKWLKAVLNDTSRQLWIAEEKEVAVGTIRADCFGGVHELSWTVAPHARGRGVGRRMVTLLAGQISDPIRAEVKSGNLASARIAEHAGMHLDVEVDGVMHYLRGAVK